MYSDFLTWWYVFYGTLLHTQINVSHLTTKFGEIRIH